MDLRYDRAWVVVLTDAALQQREEEFIAQRRAHVFDLVWSYLTQDAELAEPGAAAALGISLNAWQVLIHRTHRQYGAHLRRQVARTARAL